MISGLFDEGARVAYVGPEESADGYLWRGHPGVIELALGDGDYSVTFHRSATNATIDEQFLAPLSDPEFAQRIAAIDRREHPVELGRRLPAPPRDAPRLEP